MSKRTISNQSCPIAKALCNLGDQWTLLIARDVMMGVSTFEGFQRSLKMSRNLLTQRLRAMEIDGIVKRVIPPARKRAEYKPTQKCRDLFKVMISIKDWSEKWMPDVNGNRLEISDNNGREVSVEILNSNNERIREIEDLHFKQNLNV